MLLIVIFELQKINLWEHTLRGEIIVAKDKKKEKDNKKKGADKVTEKETKKNKKGKKSEQPTSTPAPEVKEEKAGGKKDKADKKPINSESSSPKTNLGLYPVEGKLVPITWEKETAKKITANSEVHTDAPLLKERVYKHDEKAMEKYNKLRDQITDLEAKGSDLLSKLGLHFGQ